VLSAEQSVGDLLQQYGIAVDHGLSDDQVLSRRARCGPNAVTSHRARLLPVLWNQVRSPLLGLLLIAAAASFVVGERGAAVIIAVIVGYRSGWGS
jgi:Mg2+-importing ATPase